MSTELARLDDNTMEVESMTVMMSNLMKNLTNDKNLNNDVSVETLAKNFNDDIFVEILKHLNIFESSSVADRFCQAWRKASDQDWQTLDFSMLKSNYIKTQVVPFVWVSSRFNNNLYNLLFAALNSSHGNIKTLIFHYNLYLADDQFVYTAKRCPLLRRLVFVSWNRIMKTSIKEAIRGWKDLESMTMPSMYSPKYVFKEISKNCKNFKELKNMGRLHMRLALALTKHLPNLKIDDYYNEEYRFIDEIDRRIISEKASRLCELILCKEETSCTMCRRTKYDCGIPRWYRYEEGIWKDDEVKSLAI
ncbi:F-box/LRR-repeat protein At3g48880-like [Vicia villosa]|uniref:F-box/LRR-repeat protein At3g48880-like n=1 Tax=Vicia villosa TaxID=3911 RepID=UPI00273CBD75|nr:F-box/LRR-repeat protein At3g48880-like [Vicia villosa]